jgi:hypothetical protein
MDNYADITDEWGGYIRVDVVGDRVTKRFTKGT